MNESLKKHRSILVIVLFFLVVVPGFISLFIFLNLSIEEKTDDIARVKIDQEVNNNFLESVGKLRKSKQNVEAKEENLSLLLGSDASAKIALYGDLESLARDTGHSFVENQIIDPTMQAQKKPSINDEVEGEPLIEPLRDEALIVRVSLVGTYDNFVNFLHKVENFDYLADVQSIEITARERRDDDPRLRNASQREEDQNQDDRENLIESNVEIAVYLDSLIGKTERLKQEAEAIPEDLITDGQL